MSKGESYDSFFQAKTTLPKNIVDASHNHSVFDFYVLEIVKEMFKRIKVESPPRFLQAKKEQTTVTSRLSENGLLPTVFCRTITARKSIGNTLKKFIFG